VLALSESKCVSPVKGAKVVQTGYDRVICVILYCTVVYICEFKDPQCSLSVRVECNVMK
jgi:hypothetical protein